MDLSRDRFGMRFQPIKAHSGEVKQDREGYHDFYARSDIEQMFFFHDSTSASSKVSQNQSQGFSPGNW
ncbi:MAG: hypothetical protein NVSMB27_32140 [Ktedonobacteraceae bacterium]